MFKVIQPLRLEIMSILVSGLGLSVRFAVGESYLEGQNNDRSINRSDILSYSYKQELNCPYYITQGDSQGSLPCHLLVPLSHFNVLTRLSKQHGLLEIPSVTPSKFWRRYVQVTVISWLVGQLAIWSTVKSYGTNYMHISKRLH